MSNMFDLDQSIADWRKQMLAAGIKTPVPLEELESHLREDVEQQMRSGAEVQRAFEVSTHRIGPASKLKGEFQKVQPNQPMKQKLINILAIIATLAIGMGLILPGVAKWRALETFTAFSIAMPLIGVAIFTWGAVCGAIGIIAILKRGPRA